MSQSREVEQGMGDWDAVAKVVNERMQELDLRQNKLSELSGVSLATLRKIQRGVAQERSNAVLSAVSRALQLPDEHLRAVAEGESDGAIRTVPAITSLQSEIADLRRRVEALERDTWSS